VSSCGQIICIMVLFGSFPPCAGAPYGRYASAGAHSPPRRLDNCANRPAFAPACSLAGFGGTEDNLFLRAVGGGGSSASAVGASCFPIPNLLCDVLT